jgi:GNAT superfamily N-acetyltransferase
MTSPLTLRPATDADAEFAHDLTRANMQDYVLRHWGGWDRAIFFENYARSENLIVFRGDDRIGLVRLIVRPPTVVIEDLQILPVEQNRGYGSQVLVDLADLARGRGCTSLRLRVFDENPARRLYLRCGFVEVERDGGAAWLERPVPAEPPRA